MQEIADWLTRLGLPEYAGAFAENGIDVSVLPHLTDQDLKDIGALLGHRRKILAAVAELPGKSPSASKPFPPLVEARDRHTTEPPQPAPVAAPPTEAMGERRHARRIHQVAEHHRDSAVIAGVSATNAAPRVAPRRPIMRP
jgi:SAM domain (Sterile alpha motif)